MKNKKKNKRCRKRKRKRKHQEGNDEKPFLILITQIRMIKFNFVVFNPKIELLFTNVLLIIHSPEKRGLNQVIRQIKHETVQHFSGYC